MEKRRLGNSDLQITRLGVGAWAMGGGGWDFAWGSQDDPQSTRAIHAAFDSGINWIDTAAVYGLGHSEEVVARALEGRTQRPHVFTKCSMVWGEDRTISHSLKAASIARECEASLRRLHVDMIDLFQIHWPNPDPDIEEGWMALARLKEQGKVRWIGVSNFDADQMKRAAAIAPITSLQPPYSLLKRDIEASALPYALQQGIGVIVYSPMASGLLSGAMTRERIAAMPADDWRSRHANFREPLLSRNLRIACLLREIGGRHGRSAGEVAIAWTLKHPAVTAAIVGVRSPEQVTGIVGAAELALDPREVSEIEEALKLEGAVVGAST
ncbi:MAG TPA: aldo/keto reductase [Candidatus Acidoferrales bacterium]|nr:aldo/keto reductase [Candidatus Acidoferrales bacterium]